MQTRSNCEIREFCHLFHSSRSRISDGMKIASCGTRVTFLIATVHHFFIEISQLLTHARCRRKSNAIIIYKRVPQIHVQLYNTVVINLVFSFSFYVCWYAPSRDYNKYTQIIININNLNKYL